MQRGSAATQLDVTSRCFFTAKSTTPFFFRDVVLSGGERNGVNDARVVWLHHQCPSQLVRAFHCMTSVTGKKSLGCGGFNCLVACLWLVGDGDGVELFVVQRLYLCIAGCLCTLCGPLVCVPILLDGRAWQPTNAVLHHSDILRSLIVHTPRCSVSWSLPWYLRRRRDTCDVRRCLLGEHEDGAHTQIQNQNSNTEQHNTASPNIFNVVTLELT